MKLKRIIISSAIVIALVAVVVLRLVSNKHSFDEELKMVSESNTIIPVLIDTVQYQQTATAFSVNGTFSPLQEVSITAETQGKIVSINSEIGDKVVKGQVMASIDHKISASQFELAKFNLEKAEKDLKRFEQLSKGDAATVQQYESAKQGFETAQAASTSSKVENENAIIKAPFNGIVTNRSIDIGASVLPGTPVFDLISIDKVKFIAKLTSGEADKVQKNELVTLSVDAYPGKSYEGNVRTVIVKADLSKRYDVEIEVENSTEKLIKPGMYGTVRFHPNSEEKALVIPRRAIAGSIKNPEIFLVKGDSVILQKIVATPFDDKQVVVNEGLNVGDIIVTSGQISLVNGSKIKISN